MAISSGWDIHPFDVFLSMNSAPIFFVVDGLLFWLLFSLLKRYNIVLFSFPPLSWDPRT